jgi:NADPH-dependent ferric siderophore reductase
MTYTAANTRTGRPNLPEWELEVVSTRDLTPRMRRVVLTVPKLEGVTYRAGQSLMLSVPAPENDVRRREYTIRGFDRAGGEIMLDFLMHGRTPAPEWARGAEPGARILARGPRGHTVFAENADWHLFLGDETCIPAILHILEEAPAGIRAFALIEVAGHADEMPVNSDPRSVQS